MHHLELKKVLVHLNYQELHGTGGAGAGACQYTVNSRSPPTLNKSFHPARPPDSSLVAHVLNYASASFLIGGGARV